jgi:hypothetical protein
MPRSSPARWPTCPRPSPRGRAPLLLDLAREADLTATRRLGEHLRYALDHDGEDEKGKRRHDRRGLRLSPTWAGMLGIDGLLDRFVHEDGWRMRQDHHGTFTFTPPARAPHHRPRRVSATQDHRCGAALVNWPYCRCVEVGTDRAMAGVRVRDVVMPRLC